MIIRRLLPVIACTLFACQFSYAQEDWIGGGASYTNDLYDINDTHDNLRSVPLPGVEFTLYWRHIYSNNLFSQLGASTKPYMEGFDYKGGDAYSYTSAFQAIKLNADIGYRLMLTKKLAFVPRGGVSVAVNTVTYMSTAMGIENTNRNGVAYSSIYQETDDVHRTFGLLNMAAGLEYNLWRRFTINIHAGYHKGFMNVNTLNIQYKIGQQPTYYATAKSVGDYWNLGMGVAYNLRQF